MCYIFYFVILIYRMLDLCIQMLTTLFRNLSKYKLFTTQIVRLLEEFKFCFWSTMDLNFSIVTEIILPNDPPIYSSIN